MRSSQNGAALIVALLLLLVLTILAVAGMNSASLELTMAGNEQYRQNSFQAAETGIATALINGVFNPATASEAIATNVKVTGSTSDFYTTTINNQMSGNAQPAVYGYAWDAFSTYHFQIQSAGSSARNSSLNTIQGIAVIAPADSTVTPQNPAATTKLN
jgi:type IV pilus assembly protein PilX